MPSDKMIFVAKALYLCNNIVKFDEQERHPALPKGNLIWWIRRERERTVW